MFVTWRLGEPEAQPKVFHIPVRDNPDFLFFTKRAIWSINSDWSHFYQPEYEMSLQVSPFPEFLNPVLHIFQ